MVTEQDILCYVGKHTPPTAYSPGHYEARFIGVEGNVVIETIFDDPNAKQSHIVKLSLVEWDRLVAWVEWRRKNHQYEES